MPRGKERLIKKLLSERGGCLDKPMISRQVHSRPQRLGLTSGAFCSRTMDIEDLIAIVLLAAFLGSQHKLIKILLPDRNERITAFYPGTPSPQQYFFLSSRLRHLRFCSLAGGRNQDTPSIYI